MEMKNVMSGMFGSVKSGLCRRCLPKSKKDY